MNTFDAYQHHSENIVDDIQMNDPADIRRETILTTE